MSINIYQNIKCLFESDFIQTKFERKKTPESVFYSISFSIIVRTIKKQLNDNMLNLLNMN
jgi:hypothetical protein